MSQSAGASNEVAPAEIPAEKNAIQIVDDGPIYRMIFNNSGQQPAADYVYPSNYIRTTKYTAFTFLPVNLFNQFRRFSNIYFLIAAVFAFFRNASAISPVTQVSPLVIVLLVTALKDGIEDYVSEYLFWFMSISISKPI